MNEAKSALLEIFELSSNRIFSLAKLEWWLLKHSELYNNLALKHSFLKDQGCTRYSNKYEKFPVHVVFLENYFIADRITIMQRRESYFKNEIDLYNATKHEKAATISWLIKNHSLWDEDYGLFLLDNLDESFKNSDYVFEFFNQNHEREEFRVERKAFKNTIEFIILYEDLFFSNEMLRTMRWLENYKLLKNRKYQNKIKQFEYEARNDHLF